MGILEVPFKNKKRDLCIFGGKMRTLSNVCRR